MAVRRCFSQDVVGSDEFYRLEARAQALYLHLCMAADEDGFINCAEFLATMRQFGKGSLEALVRAGFLLRVEGLYVVTHWRVSNTLKNDRARLPAYPEAAKKLYLAPNRVYQRKPNGPSLWEVKWKYLESKGRLPDFAMESALDSKTVFFEDDLDSQQSRAEHSIAEQNTAEHSRAQQNTAEHSKAQPSRAEQSTARRSAYDALAAAYPPHRRDDAFGAYCRTVRMGEEREAMDSLKRWKASEQWRNDRFIPRLSNWLERGSWRSIPEPSGLTPSGYLGEAELEAIAQVLRE